MANKFSKIPCNKMMRLMAKDFETVEKHCTDEWQVYVFERDMPTKYKLQFSGKPYIVAMTDLDAIARTN